VGDNTRKFAALDHNRTRDKFGITFLSLNNCQLIKKFQNKAKKILLEAHRHQWALDRNKCSDGKLRTYVKIKTVYGRKNYLSLMFIPEFFSYVALLFLKLFSAAQQNIFYKRKYYFI
jgi:hypothetical protein